MLPQKFSAATTRSLPADTAGRPLAECPHAVPSAAAAASSTAGTPLRAVRMRAILTANKNQSRPHRLDRPRGATARAAVTFSVMDMQASPPPILLIHGLWLTPRSWEGWKARFESRGHEVLAPAWPRMQGDVEDIRRDPSSLNGLGVAEITDHYAEIIRGLERPPIVMGHSFGGLVTELLLDRGLGAAGVAISPAPIMGVLRLPIAELRAAFPALRSPANRSKTVELTPEQF